MRHVALGAVLLVGLGRGVAAASGDPALSGDEIRRLMTDEHRHVRAVDGRIGGALADGLSRSPTFAELVVALDRSDVIVYIESDRRLAPSLAGRMLLAATPHGARYLRIQIALSLKGDDLIAVIGHELRHALEVAESEVRDDVSLIALYQAIGRAAHGLHSYDTIAAQNAGRQVLTELTG